MKHESIAFRPLTEADLPLMADWLSRPHLQKWWRKGDVTPEGLRDKYLPRIKHEDDAIPFIVLVDENPTGYIQYYRIHPEDQDWWPDHPGDGVWGIDQFIGDEENLNKGMGSGFIAAFVQQLFENPEIKEIRVDPRPDNLRAIGCYKKIGFKKIQTFSNPDGPALLMVLPRSDFLDQR